MKMRVSLLLGLGLLGVLTTALRSPTARAELRWMLWSMVHPPETDAAQLQG